MNQRSGNMMNQPKAKNGDNGGETSQLAGFDRWFAPDGTFRSEVEINDRGQIVIPAKIRDLLGLEKNSRLQIVLKKTGRMELRKVVHIPVDFSLEFDTALSGRVQAAYEKMEKGSLGDSEKLKSILE